MPSGPVELEEGVESIMDLTDCFPEELPLRGGGDLTLVQQRALQVCEEGRGVESRDSSPIFPHLLQRIPPIARG